MWTVTSQDILYRCRTPGGDRFTEFVDALIKAEAYTKGVSLSNIATNLRTNLADGGVDTEVRVAVPNDPTGWLDVATCWQYKATDGSKSPKAKFQKELRQEVRKRYSKELIEKGYGYRFCICDEITPDQRSDWEKILIEEVKVINASAPLPKVISASNLADWASHFPGFIIRFFRPNSGLEQKVLNIQSWKPSVTEITRKFVEVGIWLPAKHKILEHVDFSRKCNDVILLVQGEAGVGKTRLVYEVLSSFEGLENLVLYTQDDKKALDIAYSLANDESIRAILVADECLPEMQLRLTDLLRGHKDRVRVICLDNSGERSALGSAEIGLETIPEDEVDRILEQNFLSVPRDRRRAYVSLSRGFVRFAADLCKQDYRIATQGNISPALRSISDYLNFRLGSTNPQALTFVQALSLFRKIGYRDDVREELDHLCEILGLHKDELIQAANGLKNGPGFIAFAGRYLYITPAVIAKVAFDEAWKRWAYDPKSFLEKIPDILLESFLQRVKDSGSEEVRRIVGNFFRVWTASLKPVDLMSISKVKRFETLVETNPEYYLPQLAQLVDRASKDELLRVYGGTASGPRRILVWLAERMARLDEFFPYAELMLWKLALAESESYIANNATHVWQDLFRVFLSGTSIPFSERIALLQNRLATENEQEITLALGALSKAFETQGSRVVGSPLVAGRIPPEQWQPKTQLELRQSIDLALDVLIQTARGSNPMLKDGAMNVAIKHMRTFLLNGYLEQMKMLFPATDVPHNVLLPLLNQVEDILEFNSDAPLEIQEWLNSFIPDGFHGKLIRIVRKSPWGASFRGNQESWHQEIGSLAQQLCQNQELLQFEIEWLSSAHAVGVWELGRAMGKCDQNATCLDFIMQPVLEKQFAGLARGYIGNLIRNHPQHTATVNAWIDRIEIQQPVLAYELFMAGGNATQALARTLRLIDLEKLSLAHLDGFIPDIFDRSISSEEFIEMLQRPVGELQKEDNDLAIETAVKLVHHRLRADLNDEQSLNSELPEVWEMVWTILENAINHSWADSYQWADILRVMLKLNETRVAQIASLALVGEGHQQEQDAAEILVQLAENQPNLVIQQVGKVILSEEYGWHFYIEKYRYLINSLPLDPLKNWLRSVGVLGVQRIASNLAVPFLDEHGNPVVPPLTEFVLSKFEDDERTFRSFCSGSHSLQIYVGDISSQKLKEVEIAEKFLNHPLRRVREWALYEISDTEQQAKFWEQLEEERKIDFS